MPRNFYPKFITWCIVFIIISVFFFAGCSPRPWPRERCIVSHTETKISYWPANNSAGSYNYTPDGFGIHVGSGLHLVSEPVCDSTAWFDSTGRRIR